MFALRLTESLIRRSWRITRIQHYLGRRTAAAAGAAAAADLNIVPCSSVLDLLSFPLLLSLCAAWLVRQTGTPSQPVSLPALPPTQRPEWLPDGVRHS